MIENFTQRLAAINGSSVHIIDVDVPLERGQAPAVMLFSDGSKLRAVYWRLIKDRMM
jgi:hypothetical protein